MRLRSIAAIVLFVLGLLSVATAPASAEEAEGPADCGAYEEASPQEEPNCGSDGELPEGVYDSGPNGLDCPDGWTAEGPNQMCYQLEVPIGGDEHCDLQWVDVVGGIVESVCLDPTGFESGTVYYNPANICHSGGFVAVIGMTNHLECVSPDHGAEEPDEVIIDPVDEPIEEPTEAPKDSDEYESGTDTGSTDENKGVYPVIGTAYVVNTGGEGVICRDAPNGAKVTTLAEGTPVSELADGVADGWQMVSYQASDTSFPSCFVSAEFLGDAPTVVESEEVETTNGGDFDDVETAEASTEGGTHLLITVDGMPSTGSGDTATQLTYGQTVVEIPQGEESMITEDQREWFMGLAVFCGAILVIFGVCQLSKSRH